MRKRKSCQSRKKQRWMVALGTPPASRHRENVELSSSTGHLSLFAAAARVMHILASPAWRETVTGGERTCEGDGGRDGRSLTWRYCGRVEVHSATTASTTVTSNNNNNNDDNNSLPRWTQPTKQLRLPQQHILPTHSIHLYHQQTKTQRKGKANPRWNHDEAIFLFSFLFKTFYVRNFNVQGYERLLARVVQGYDALSEPWSYNHTPL